MLVKNIRLSIGNICEEYRIQGTLRKLPNIWHTFIMVLSFFFFFCLLHTYLWHVVQHWKVSVLSSTIEFGWNCPHRQQVAIWGLMRASQSLSHPLWRVDHSPAPSASPHVRSRIIIPLPTSFFTFPCTTGYHIPLPTCVITSPYCLEGCKDLPISHALFCCMKFRDTVQPAVSRCFL